MCAGKSVIGKLKDSRGWVFINNVTNINPKSHDQKQSWTLQQIGHRQKWTKNICKYIISWNRCQKFKRKNVNQIKTKINKKNGGGGQEIKN